MNAVPPPIHRVRQDHMATYFEIQVAHEDEKYARQAAQAAFQITARLENLLSRYRESSEVAQIRRLPPDEILRLTPDTFSCLQLAAEMHRITGGAFDPALGTQMDAFRGDPSRQAAGPASLIRGSLILNPGNFTVCCKDASVNLDLGAIGKGFALDRMAEELREWKIDRALLIAGGSSVLALGGPDPALDRGWEISLSGGKKLFLGQSALGASGTSVKGGHILDPRTASSATGPYRAWALARSAAFADALSTAWMLLNLEEIEEICRTGDDLGAILRLREDDPENLIRIPRDLAFSASPTTVSHPHPL